MKKIFLWPLTLAIIFFTTDPFCLTAAEKYKLVAANYSDRYHLSTCKVAQNIPAEDLLVFETPGQAIEGGFRPCRKCDPPVENIKKS